MGAFCNRHVNFFDTTLRDGEQAPGYSLTPEQKVEIAMLSEALGSNTIEVGFPNSSPTDFEAARQISTALTRATPCVFSRATEEDIKACAKATDKATRRQIQIATLGSDIHIRYKRGITRQAVLDEAKRAIAMAKALGFEDISLAVEDATRTDFDFLKQLLDIGLEGGVTAFAIPDTVGYCLPEEFGDLIGQIRAYIGESIRISIHCHNDLGLAVSNSLAGIMAGGDEVQVTMGGIGERAGNASMEELVAILNYKASTLRVMHDIIQHRLHVTVTKLAEFVNFDIPAHKPIVGRNAFATEAGMHQQGVINSRFTYEFMRAEDFGAASRTVVGRHSGRNILRQRLLQSGVRSVSLSALDRLYNQIMAEPHVESYNDVQLLRQTYEAVLAASKVQPVNPHAAARDAVAAAPSLREREHAA